MTAPPTILTSKGLEVRREGVDGSRWYTDPQTDRDLVSVTTVIGASTSKPWLTSWAAKLAAQAAVEHLALLGPMIEAEGPEAAVAWLKAAAQRKRDEASERGTWLHDVVEAFALDTSLPDMPDDVVPYAEAFFAWCCEWEPEFLMSECTVASQRHGYAGTMDLALRIPRFAGTEFDGVWALDAKSGANLDAYMPVQLAAYARAEEVWLPFGRKTAMPKIDRLAVLHVRPEGVKFLDVTDQADEAAFHTFLRMVETLDWKDRQGGRLGRVLYLPDEHGHQPPPLLEDLDGVPARAALSSAGITRLDHLAEAGPEKCLALPGFGPAALYACCDLLRLQGMDADPWDDAVAEHQAAAKAKAEAGAARIQKRLADHDAGKHERKPLVSCARCQEVPDASA